MNIKTFIGTASLLLVAATGAAAQSAVGMPFHNGNTLFHSYSYRSISDGAYAPHVHGAVLGRQFGREDTRLALFAGGGVGVDRQETEAEYVNLRAGLSLSRRLVELDSKLSVAAMVGGEIFLTEDGRDQWTRWGNVRLPVTLGLGYDVTMGAVTLTPYANSTLAWYREDQWQDEAKVQTTNGRDLSGEAGATLQWKVFSLGAGYAHGEHGFNSDGRFKVALGVNF